MEKKTGFRVNQSLLAIAARLVRPFLDPRVHSVSKVIGRIIAEVCNCSFFENDELPPSEAIFEGHSGIIVNEKSDSYDDVPESLGVWDLLGSLNYEEDILAELSGLTLRMRWVIYLDWWMIRDH